MRTSTVVPDRFDMSIMWPCFRRTSRGMPRMWCSHASARRAYSLQFGCNEESGRRQTRPFAKVSSLFFRSSETASATKGHTSPKRPETPPNMPVTMKGALGIAKTKFATMPPDKPERGFFQTQNVSFRHATAAPSFELDGARLQKERIAVHARASVAKAVATRFTHRASQTEVSRKRHRRGRTHL